jgi:hypothetical protein
MSFTKRLDDLSAVENRSSHALTSFKAYTETLSKELQTILNGYLDTAMLLEYKCDKFAKLDLLKPEENVGTAKHSLILSLYFLVKAEAGLWDVGRYYDDAMAETCMFGGDIGANCAAVGGMVGALVGLSNLPKKKT